MSTIISVSRRTDVPAFYGRWFMNRVRQGYAGVVHPFGGKRYIVSLKSDDVAAFVFWTKDATAFMGCLDELDEAGYRFYFSYTIGASGELFEPGVDRARAIETLKQLSRRYSPAHVNWRFDPIVLTDRCGRRFYIEQFRTLASQFAGSVERCIISFVDLYGKVRRNFQQLEQRTGVATIEPDMAFKIDLASELAEIASQHSITLQSCCGDYLLSETVGKAHCVDGELIERLFGPFTDRFKAKPTRRQCGCTESIDIGTYDTCPHGCVYCYANTNAQRAGLRYAEHDPESAFLGYSKAQSDAWLAELRSQSQSLLF